MPERGQSANKIRRLADKIEGLLPQTQCRQCGYGGCRPYAEALAGKNAKPDRCKPGGNKTSHKLASLLGCEISELRNIDDNKPEVAYINGERCVGCYKCIEACPVDAIIGAHGLMHTIMREHCTGCGLCLEPCPVDCIGMVPATGIKGDGQLVLGGVIDDDVAKAAAKRLYARWQKKLARPSLRGAEQGSDVDPAELARKALNRAKRRLSAQDK